MTKVLPARSDREIADAARLMRGLVAANRELYADDIETIDAYYSGSWFFEDRPVIPEAYRPPQGDVMLRRLDEAAAGTVAIYRMDDAHCRAVIGLARKPSYRAIVGQSEIF